MARNTVTLNGVSSSTITGLLIQELPPIAKPPIRTEVEEIDGRDGDIITELGYGAYDKEFTIGLFGNFDINEIIAFFDSKGTVTFSNESDKYYRYQIIEQIDFERLAHFRTATVKMHVQPFKFSTTETTRTLTAAGTVTNAGNIVARPTITFTGTGDVTIKLNGEDILTLALGETSTALTIDAEAQEAYIGTTDTLANRQVDGDYENIKLNVGSNTIAWTGSLTSIAIDKYSRWI